MVSALKNLFRFYILFGLGFFAGCAFTGVIAGFYGYKIDTSRLPYEPATEGAAL